MSDSKLSVVGYDRDALTLRTRSLAVELLPINIVVQSLPGTVRIQIPLCVDERIESRVEFPVEDREKIVVCVDRDSAGKVYVSSPGRRPVSTLAAPGPDPVPPISRPTDAVDIDISLVIDGTMRVNLSQHLLGGNDALADYAAKLNTFLGELSNSYGSARVSVMAFGDQPMPGNEVKADELQPSYDIYPERKEDRRFRPLNIDLVAQSVQAIPATSGGDFVDALADALFAASSLHWRPTARKLLVLTGDSPGHSTEFPLHPGGDICARERDVDVEAMRLHRQGVEILTVYYDPSPSEIGLEQLKGRGLLEDTRRQYRRLASLPEMAFVASTFDPKKAAEVVLNRPPLIGRGSSYGILLEDGDTGRPGKAKEVVEKKRKKKTRKAAGETEDSA